MKSNNNVILSSNKNQESKKHIYVDVFKLILMIIIVAHAQRGIVHGLGLVCL